MNTKIITAIATLGCAMLGLTSEAKADFLVLCPTGGFTGAWTHTEGFQFSGPHAIPSQKELRVPPTRFLNCGINLSQLISISYATPGVCGGTVSLSAPSAVFRRPELFQSATLPARSFTNGRVCTLEVDVSSFTLSLEMTEECGSLSSGNGWSCPDSARQVVPEFGG
ncbi:MAG TPA: hypothetical protein VJU61_03560 [Polyangiaceae bacterium]|nr:hypothetical protein [Polyangiaceae bacterium]